MLAVVFDEDDASLLTPSPIRSLIWWQPSSRSPDSRSRRKSGRKPPFPRAGRVRVEGTSAAPNLNHRSTLMAKATAPDTTALSVSEAAAAIVALINASPRSPRPHEIGAIIAKVSAPSPLPRSQFHTA